MLIYFELSKFMFTAHNLPLQIGNANLYQPTFDVIICTRISLWGKNDHF